MNSSRTITPTSHTGNRARAIALLATVALMVFSLGVGTAIAADGRDHRNAENTFTKWVTGAGVAPVLANMAGVVGGDVGDGAFSGEVMSKTLTSTGAVIDAIYHFNGSQHSFTASVHVVQTGLVAVVTGRVTDGWLKDNLVEGAYTQTTCPASPAAGHTCFQGTLDILRGSKSWD